MDVNEMQTDLCDINIIHYETLSQVRNELPSDETIYEVSELFKVFGDFTRSRIICALKIAEMCVCDIAALLNMSNSAISHQLRTLKQARIVRSRRKGKSVYYRLADEHIMQIFDIAFEHMMEDQG